MIKAVSFDLWDTVLVDDSDEPKRKAKGLLPKAEERRALMHQALNRQAPIDRAHLDVAYDAVDAAFCKVWHDQHVTWSVRERLEVLLRGLRCQLPADDLQSLVYRHEEMELHLVPDLAPGVADMLRVLRQKYKLVVISDAVFSPGRILRQILEHHRILEPFCGHVYSDELGCSKPDPRSFQRAAELAGCALHELVHVGDREHNDVLGAHRAGAHAVLTTVVLDRGSADTEADAVCKDYARLPELIAGIGEA